MIQELHDTSLQFLLVRTFGLDGIEHGPPEFVKKQAVPEREGRKTKGVNP
jgi:hypothetical protein